MFLYLSLLFGTSLASCKFKFIHNASELISFSNDVNSGTSYSDYTVYLVNDIKFNKGLSKQFNPIGLDSYFYGVFDGQGYTITNLALNSSSHYRVALFGTTLGLTIKNVVLDSTCSISSYFYSSNTDAVVGGIVGHCNPYYGPCIIENNVNMANISFYGSVGAFLWMGGIAGNIYISTSTYDTKIGNCANYGIIYNSGTCSPSVYMGGITGEIYAYSDVPNDYVYNCINYGEVRNKGTATNYYLSGLVSVSWGATIANCMSTGQISSTNGGSLGAIFSEIWNYQTKIKHCFWTSDTNCNNYYATIISSVDYFNSSLTSLSPDNAHNMNTYATTNGWNEWTYNENNVNIKFVVHNGKGFTISSSKLVLLPKAERRGYSFSFWCVNRNSSSCSNKYSRTKTSGFTSTTTLYAQWVVNSCTVTFDVNGGDTLNENDKILKTLYDQKMGKLPVTTKRGYTFVGWYNVLDELFTDNSLINNACNCSLYAHWIPNKYNVSFDANGGVELENNTKEVTFDDIYGELPTPNRSGFTFVGWFAEDNKLITNKTIVNITNNQTLYANWTANKYNIKLDVNGGNKLTGYDDGIEVPADRAYEYLQKPNRTGYTFIGWFTEDNKLITNDKETTAIVNKNQVVHAEWIPNNYTVSFNVTGGDELVGYEDGINVTFDAKYGSLPIPTRTGYSFVEWLDGNNEAITSETIVNITSDCTLYANWTGSNYEISFDACGGEELANITVTFDGNYTCLPTPTREGYTFLWWYIKGTNKIVFNDTKVETACNHTLCAAWNKNTVIFDVNGGDELDDSEKEKEVTYDDTYKTLPTPTRNGYTFDGWFNEDNVEIKNDTKVEITSEQALHAGWTPNNYTLTLDVNGGDALGEDSINVTYDGAYGYIPEPSRTGYTFIGWYTENNKYVTSDTTVTDACHCTLRANWTANTYIITFDASGGDELDEDEKNTTVTYDGTYDSLPTPTRDGYTFDGWFNENNEEITEGTIVIITNNQTLHANWTANPYTVTLNPNGGELAEDDRITVTYDETYKYLPKPVKEGYVFDGWYTEDDKLITSETKVEIANDHTLYARWTETVTPTEYVEIVFGKGDMTEEEINNVLNKIIIVKFKIVEIDHSKSDETTAIIRFDDIEDAKNFIAALNESSDSVKHFIRSASFNSWVDKSISTLFHPYTLLNILLI